MKQLKDLKDELLEYKLTNFYVFYGEDFGIKHHYIERIKSKCTKLTVVDSVDKLFATKTGKSLFKEKTVYVILNDTDFASQPSSKIQTYINRLGDDILILSYEQELPSTNLFKDFGDYITWFPRVKQNIAVQFIDDLVCLSTSTKEYLAQDCLCDYGTILLECDKINCYSNEHNVSNEESYQNLRLNNQLIVKIPDYDVEDFMNDILTKNYESLSYWYYCIIPNHTDDFWISLNYIFYNFLIAYLIKKYGPSNGSSQAYNFKLPWNRTKAIRELNIKYTAQELLDIADKICNMDYLVKQGVITIDGLFDYFICYII